MRKRISIVYPWITVMAVFIPFIIIVCKIIDPYLVNRFGLNALNAETVDLICFLSFGYGLLGGFFIILFLKKKL